MHRETDGAGLNFGIACRDMAITGNRFALGTPFTSGSVHEQDFPDPDPAFAPGEASKTANRLFEIKYAIQTAIEARIRELRRTLIEQERKR